MKLLFVLSLSLLLSGRLVKANEEASKFALSRIRFKISEWTHFHHLFFDGEELQSLSAKGSGDKVGGFMGIDLFEFIIYNAGTSDNNGMQVQIVLFDDNSERWTLHWDEENRRLKMVKEESSTLWKIWWGTEDQNGLMRYRFEYQGTERYLRLNLRRTKRTKGQTSKNPPLFSLNFKQPCNIYLDNKINFLYLLKGSVYFINFKDYLSFESKTFKPIGFKEVTDPSLKAIPQKNNYDSNAKYSAAMLIYLEKVHSYLKKAQETTEIEHENKATNS